MVAEDVGQVLGLPPEPASLNGHSPGLAHAPLEPYDLAGVMRQALPPPRVFCGLLYPRTIHTIAGPPESAKTIIALWLGLQAMKAGQPVAMVDEETGPRQVADLLSSMGATPELIAKRFLYLTDTGLRWSAPDRQRLGAVLDEVRPRLLILDSVSEILAAADIDDNDGMAVTRFMKTVVKPIPRLYGSAVVLIDHDAKDAKPGSRYAKGSGAKLAATVAAFKVEALRPFSRDQDGLVKLWVSKDRLGCLHRHWRVRVRTSPLILDFDKATAADFTEGGGGKGMSPAAEKLLAMTSVEPATQRQLVDRVVAEYGHGLKRETVSRALNWLAEAGLLERMDLGRGREALWARPGGQLPDPEDPGPSEPAGGWPPGSEGEAANL